MWRLAYSNPYDFWPNQNPYDCGQSKSMCLAYSNPIHSLELWSVQIHVEFSHLQSIRFEAHPNPYDFADPSPSGSIQWGHANPYGFGPTPIHASFGPPEVS